MLALSVDHQAGIPLLRQPLSGKTSDAIDVRHVVTAHLAPLHLTYGTAYLVADSALDKAAHRQQLAPMPGTWITRVPATLSEAQAALAAADPPTMAPLMEGYRSHLLGSTSGDAAHRWRRISAEHRRPQAQPTVETPRLRQGAAEVQAFKPLSRTAFACEAEAQQALATFTPGWQATRFHAVTIRPTRHSATRGRPGKATVPTAQACHSEGALTSPLAVRAARVAQHRCVMLAPTALDAGALSPPALLAGYQGQQQAERGVRFLQEPLLRASSRYLKNPPRSMALVMVLTVWWWVYAALEHRIRPPLREPAAPFPDQTGQPIQNPTARGVFQCFVGIHRLRIPGQGPLVLNLMDTHEPLLQRLGPPYQAFYACTCTRRGGMSDLIMNGVDLKTVMRLLGHKDIRMTLRYAHLSREHLQAAVGTLDRSFEVGTKREQGTSV
jgi:transposase